MDTFVQQLINGLTIGSIYALIALGYTMVYGILRLINFAHGDIYMVGAYAGFMLATALGFAANPSAFGFAVTLVGSMAIAAAHRHGDRAVSLIVPVQKIFENDDADYGNRDVAFNRISFHFFFFGERRARFRSLIHNENHTLFGNATISTSQILIFVVSILLMIALQYIIFYTKIGKAMRAVSFNLNSAKLMGINTDFVIAFTFALGSALAAAGGVLTAQYNPKIDPLMGIMYGLKAFVAAVLGGIGNIPGAVLGGLLIGAAETLVVGYGGYIGIPSTYRDAVAFAILILVLLVRPAGLARVERAGKSLIH